MMTHIAPIIVLAGFVCAISSAPAVAAICEIIPQSVNFGNYDTLDPQSLDGVGNISVNCDAEATFTISLDQGTAASGRRMTSGAKLLDYNLYVDAARLIVWGDGTAGTSTVTNTASMAEVTIHGRIPARQNVAAGSYADVIIVTIAY